MSATRARMCVEIGQCRLWAVYAWGLVGFLNGITYLALSHAATVDQKQRSMRKCLTHHGHHVHSCVGDFVRGFGLNFVGATIWIVGGVC